MVTLAPPPNADLDEYRFDGELCDRFQVYGGVPLGHVAPVAPNTMQGLTTLFNHLHMSRVPLAVETGSLNPDASVQHFIREVREIARVFDRYPGLLTRISADEALGKMLDNSHRGDGVYPANPAGAATVGREVIPWVRAVDSLGLEVNLIEPFPVCGSQLLIPYLNTIRAHVPRAKVSLTLDINWWEAMSTGPRNWGSPFWSWLWRRGYEAFDPGRQGHYARINEDLRQVHDWCSLDGIPFGVIIGSPFIPTYPKTDQGFYQSAEEQLLRLSDAIPLNEVDEFVVQSWWPFHMKPGETDVDQVKDRPSRETMLDILDVVAGDRTVFRGNRFFE